MFHKTLFNFIVFTFVCLSGGSCFEPLSTGSFNEPQQQGSFYEPKSTNSIKNKLNALSEHFSVIKETIEKNYKFFSADDYYTLIYYVQSCQILIIQINNEI